jgi:hypothetical protein
VECQICGMPFEQPRGVCLDPEGPLSGPLEYSNDFRDRVANHTIYVAAPDGLAGIGERRNL